MSATVAIPADLLEATEVLWDYHDMHHELRPTDVGIGLGSHDLGVADCAAQLYHQHVFPLIVFTGANAPTTVERFPRGEAVHYTEHALQMGVPAEAIITEPAATNTGENIVLTRAALAARRISPETVMLISRPYQQRRAYATCRKVWPEVEVVCTSLPLALAEYIESIGDADRVLNMLVGDTQRIELYAQLGFAVPQPMPEAVKDAFDELVARGYTTRLV
ncbi:YdcF family protein [Kribbella sp. NPDC056345]|uniref:YdcF family protein n=1 Tax=Kribbella sp. NPDC056345 TaxID=3345789 RepID=UPI0035E083D1